jgi:hypothetical protein
MTIQGKKLTRLRVAQPKDVEDQCVVSADVYRTEKGREQITGEHLAGAVPLWDLIEWALREGYLSWRDDPRYRSELQELRR